MAEITFLELWFSFTFAYFITKVLVGGDEEEIKKEPVQNTSSEL